MLVTHITNDPALRPCLAGVPKDQNQCTRRLTNLFVTPTDLPDAACCATPAGQTAAVQPMVARPLLRHLWWPGRTQE